MKKNCRDLKAVYSAVNAEAGHDALEEFEKIQNEKYPMIYKSWQSN
jgi:transposase-like protein